MTDCVFCKMVSGEIEPDKVYEDEHVLAFRDIDPQAPTHVLVIPKQHVDTINDLDQHNIDLVGKMVLAAAQVAKQEGIAQPGYRTVLNCNPEGGQSVFHIHLHLLGGRRMRWPPG
jgi:histidine triad (HIT) family protein